MSNDSQAYWQANIRLVLGCLAVWFLVSYGCGILLAPLLNSIHILGGYPLGFWFAQQGSIYVFVLLIFYYTWKMKKIERKYDLDD